MPAAAFPLDVASPAALHASVNSAAITPSDSLPLRSVKASQTDPNGIFLEALAVGTGGNSVTLDINLPADEDTDLVVAVTGNNTVVTLAATGTPSVLDAQGIRFQSVVKGTSANDIEVEFVDPGTASAAASVSVSGTEITLNLATDAGSKSILVNQGMTFEAVEAGADGDDITIALINPGTPSAAIDVDVTSTDIVVNLATDAGTAQVETATAAGTVAGVAQVETATAAGNVSTSGNATVTVTASGMTNSPKTISVAVLSSDDDGSAIASRIRAALTADADVAAFFAVSGATDQVILTRLTAAANDATMNIAIIDGTSVGVTTAATSANTTAGVLGSGNATVTVTGSGITGSPLAVPVAVVQGDTASVWAGKVRVALAATAAITALYTVGGTGTTITLTEKVPNGNDATLNIALATGTATGITTAATSANTTAGVAPAITTTRQSLYDAIVASSAASALITVNFSAGEDTVLTALTETPLADGGADPAITTTRQQALTLLLAESDVTDIVTVAVDDVNPLRTLVALAMTPLAGGSVTSSSTVQAVVNALNANGDFDGLAVASTDVNNGSRIAKAGALVTLAGGVTGQWAIDYNFTRALSANADGNIAYLPVNGSAAVTVAVKAGVMYPIAAKGVNSTSTTATGIVGHV